MLQRTCSSDFTTTTSKNQNSWAITAFRPKKQNSVPQFLRQYSTRRKCWSRLSNREVSCEKVITRSSRQQSGSQNGLRVNQVEQWKDNGKEVPLREWALWGLVYLVLLGALKKFQVFLQPIFAFIATSMENFVYNKNFTQDNYFLSEKDNFFPVKNELTTNALPVIGSIPDDLSGVYLRNGPNPQHQPRGKYYWFEGDGMVHACRIEHGNVYYSNRFIQTEQYVAEKALGHAELMKWGDAFTQYGLLALIADTLRFIVGLPSRLGIGGEANTTLVHHEGRLYALQDQGCTPYLLFVEQKGQIQTLQQMNIPKEWDVTGIECHCKVDPQTKDMFFMSQCYHKAPYLKIGQLAPDGEQLVRWYTVNLKEPIYMHDFAITENYLVVVDHPLPISMMKILFGSGIPLGESSRQTRVGIICRKTGEIKWYPMNTPGFMMHVANARETDDGKIVVHAVVHKENPIKTIFPQDATIPSPSSYFGKYTIDLNSNQASFEFLLDSLCEFPTINQNYLGQQCRYTYLTWIDHAEERDSVRPVGIIKYDMIEDREVQRIRFQQYIDGQEPLFVPKDNSKLEDEGYLMMYTNHSKTQQSSFIIFDAKSMDPIPLATVNLPQRVPFGFHGVYLTEQELSRVKLNSNLLK
eukprot:TRINITY_DN4694_c0_g1_i2.p1 TRINITY_DN4694_c0_g1~~TRINITY_DN4694_c0_g1_i2.p1  ORF type:complete len:636 (-),score=70.30 TRINITY_DN4694_c0_g1_i2:323-2230(-)